MEWLVQEENQIYNEFGIEGDGWDYDEAEDTFQIHVAEKQNTAPSNSIPGLLDDRFDGRMAYDEDHAWAKRQTAIDLYGDNRIELSHIIPPLSFSADAQEKADNYKLVIFQRYVSSQMKNWIMGSADVNADWDEYVSQVKSLGLDEYISLYQEAYNNFAN